MENRIRWFLDNEDDEFDFSSLKPIRQARQVVDPFIQGFTVGYFLAVGTMLATVVLVFAGR